jgi:hypothetical protein
MYLELPAYVKMKEKFVEHLAVMLLYLIDNIYNYYQA